MKAHLLVGLALTACGSHEEAKDPPTPSTPPTPTEAEQLGVVYERMLTDANTAPLFGPDGSVTVGEHRWTAGGAYMARHAFARNGQVRPVAITGTADAPRMIAIGWSHLDGVPPAPPAEDRAWLVTADVASATTTPIHQDFLADSIELSPDGSLLVAIERDDIVIRHAETGIERARHALGRVEKLELHDVRRACWLDDEHVAWIGTGVLRVASVHGSIANTPLAQPATIVACDPAGDAAAVALPGSIAILDLANAAIVAAQVVDDQLEHHVAIGARGQRLAIASDRGFTLYRRDGDALAPAFAISKPVTEDELDTPHLAFSRDGKRLAVAGATLMVIGDISNALPPLAEVPHVTVELPRGFVDGAAIDVAWRHGQLPVPSGRAQLPALLFQAGSEDPYAHAIGLAVDRAELPRVPPDSATDAEMRAFAKRTMERWFEAWQLVDLDRPDEEYTIALGRTDGKRWFETRELHRDGCEPFDAYTRVVIDTHFVYIVRAITVPGGPIDGWLAPFFDAPFRAHTKTALRRGRRSGPC